MTFTPVVICIALGFLTCWGLVPLIRRIILKRADSDRSGEFHHTHTTPVPRVGGAALAAAFTAVAIAVAFLTPSAGLPVNTRWVLAAGSLAMFGLGFWDDLRSLGAKFKLLSQCTIASAVYFGGIQIEMLKNPFNDTVYTLGPFGFLATVGWLVVLTNLVNLIDGIDGLAGGICFMLMCLLVNVGMGVDATFTTLISAGMAGALLGFLYYNFPPAKIYMGDGGAYFLGFLIGVLSIVNSHKGSVAAALIAPVFALALPILDVSLAVLRRGLKGLPIFRPDRKHIHHRLIDLGLSRARTVLVLYTVSCLCLFLGFGVFWLQGRMLPLFFGTLFLILIIAGRSFGFIKNWLPVAKSLSKSFTWRDETSYALTLGRWLQMEAERRDSIFELWQDYQFVVKKLGFSEVKMTLPDGENIWRAFAPGGPLQRTRHEMNGVVIEFAAQSNVLPAELFELLAELAAESWQKAARRWQELHKAPLRFVSVASADTASAKKKTTRLYAPAKSDLWSRGLGLARPSS